MGAIRKSSLTKREKEFISSVACDLESGNHLLYPRSKEYRDFFKKVLQLLNTENLNEWERGVVEYYRQCSDYYYWLNLPDEEKLF